MPEADPRRIRSLFDQALALPTAAREAFLVSRCGSDTALKQRLQAMLAAADDPQFLASPTGVNTNDDRVAIEEGTGSHIGPYHLLEQIGEGGFGLVFLAEQVQPVSRRVALKIVKLGMDTKQVVARFEQERQALALMDHPNIARVLDAGATASGRPYFVMDLVRGLPIVEHCDRHQLPIAARLAIFAQVCDAVQHAHGKGVIHRDLKPSNVLVTLHDDRPVAKVIDFGVAKATSSPLTEKTLFTEQRQILGTLQYMSPEQAEGSPDIDTRTDIYALGVLLYELLTGSTPFSFGTQSGGSLADLQRRIRETDPPTPSQRLTESHERLVAIAARRREEPQRLASTLRGELDWMVMKALEKDRAARYETASAFAQDVRRHLAGEAVQAAPPSTGYRLRKFVRRNRALVTAGLAVAAALLLGVVGTTMALFQAIAETKRADLATAAEASAKVEAQQNAERARAQAQAAELAKAAEAQARVRAETIRDFVVASLQTSDASAGGRADTTVFAAMQNAIRELDGERFRDDPETAAALRGTISDILRNNGRYETALTQARLELDLLRRVHRGDHADLATCLGDVARALEKLGHHAESEQLTRDALAMYERLYPGDNEHTAAMLNNLGASFEAQGRAAEAERTLQQALAMHRRLYPEPVGTTAMMLDNLAKAESALGREDLALQHYREAVAVHRQVHPGNHPMVAVHISNLGVQLGQLGRNDEAVALFEEALAMRRQLYPGDHPSICESLNNLAFLRTRMDRAREAVPLLEEAVAMNRRLWPEGNPQLAHSLYTLATTHLELENAAAALPFAEQAVAMHRQLFAHDYIGTAASLLVQARCQIALKQHDGARSSFDASLPMLRKLPEGRAALREALRRSTALRGSLGDLAGALPELEELVAISTEDLPADSEYLAQDRAALELCRTKLAQAGK